MTPYGVAEELRRVQQMLSATDINSLTPVEALLKLAELKGIVEGKGEVSIYCTKFLILRAIDANIVL